MENMQVGSKGNNVSTVQQFLKSLGLYSGAIDGDYGPKTQAAVKQFQSAQGLKSDGIVGPLTENKIQAYTIANHPAVKEAMANDPDYAAAMNGILNNPELSKAAAGAYKMLGNGTYTPEQYAKEYGDQYNALDAYYKENQKYGQTGAENTLGLNQRNYDRSVAADEGQFQEDKQALDKSAADNGILFSTGRRENEGNLQSKYNANAQQKYDTYTSGQKGILNDYQYKYGTPAVNSLSSYMSANGPTKFNAGSPVNNTNPGTLSSYYNPSSGNYYGTNNTSQQTNTASNTNDYFKNLQNKSNLEGYKTKI